MKAKVFYMGCYRQQRKPRMLTKAEGRNPAAYNKLAKVWKVQATCAAQARGKIFGGEAELVHEKKVLARRGGRV